MVAWWTAAALVAGEDCRRIGDEGEGEGRGDDLVDHGGLQRRSLRRLLRRIVVKARPARFTATLVSMSAQGLIAARRLRNAFVYTCIGVDTSIEVGIFILDGHKR